MKDIRERTEAGISPATGTVYLALQRLEDDGLVADTPRPKGADDDTRRRYYRLTRFGRRVVAAEAERLLALAQQAANARIIPHARLRGGKADGPSR
jgi:DNA-binding PadR family transcriptional regulator